MDWLAPLYPWVKSIHVIAIIAWMAALLYLPRLYVYHSGVAPGTETSETFKVMERRLLRAIADPAMTVAWLAGLMLAFTPGIVDWASDGWFHLKFTAVLALSGVHGVMASWCKAFARDERPRSAGFFRAFNEVPTVLMIVIVIMVIARPF